jgi:leucyl aminopeptidase
LSPGFTDSLELYYTATADAPAWIPLGTVRTSKPGLQTLSRTYTLPDGPLQAVRARYRHRGAAGPCGPGPYIDHDDLVFAVQ